MKLRHYSFFWALWVLFGGLSGPAVAGPGAHGPNGEHLDAPAVNVSAGAPHRRPDGVVFISKASQRLIKIRTAVANPTSQAKATEISGVVVMDPNATGRVQTLHGGRFLPGARGIPVVGQSIRKGDALGEVRFEGEPFSQSDQRVQLADVHARKLIAEQRAQRLATLEGSVARREIEAARLEAAALREQELSLRQSLLFVESLQAPISGLVSKAGVVPGQVVERREVLFEIIDPSKLMIEAPVSDPAFAARIKQATLRSTVSLPLVFRGAGPVLQEGRLPLRFALKDAAAGTLAVGQPVSLLVHTDEEVEGVVVPSEAVVRNPSNQFIVWVKVGVHLFAPHLVDTVPLDAQSVVITRGLPSGSRVVVEGASLISQIR